MNRADLTTAQKQALMDLLVLGIDADRSRRVARLAGKDQSRREIAQ